MGCAAISARLAQRQWVEMLVERRGRTVAAPRLKVTLRTEKRLIRVISIHKPICARLDTIRICPSCLPIAPNSLVAASPANIIPNIARALLCTGGRPRSETGMPAGLGFTLQDLMRQDLLLSKFSKHVH